MAFKASSSCNSFECMLAVACMLPPCAAMCACSRLLISVVMVARLGDGEGKLLLLVIEVTMNLAFSIFLGTERRANFNATVFLVIKFVFLKQQAPFQGFFRCCHVKFIEDLQGNT